MSEFEWSVTTAGYDYADFSRCSALVFFGIHIKLYDYSVLLGTAAGQPQAMNIEILQTDITTLQVDAIVNAANKALCGGGGVDGAIHRAAGPELLAECRTLKGCETGHAKITKGYALPSKYIIHAVGPVWYGGHKNEEALLASCYREVLSIASAHNITSIAFPAISCGAYKFPIEKACDIAITETLHHIADTPINHVIFTYFERKIGKALNDSYAKWEAQ